MATSPLTVTGSGAPIANMGTVAKDPAKNVSAPNTILPANQALNPGVASGVSIWGPTNLNTAGSTPPKIPTSTTSTTNTNTANLLTSSVPKTAPIATAGSTVAPTTTQPITQPVTQPITPPPPMTPPTTDPTTTPSTTPSPYTAPNGGLYGQLINQQANRAQSSPEYTTAAAAYQKAVADRNTLKQQMDAKLSDVNLEAIPLEFQQGRQQVLSQRYAQQLADADAAVTQAQQGMQYATSQYGAQTGALGNALGAAGVQLQGGQYMPYGGDNSNMAGGIANATKWAIAQQNMAQGANHQGAADQLSSALQTMEPLGQKLSSFISDTGQNPYTAPLLNEKLKTINGQLYPQQLATLNSAVNDIRSYAIQILGSQSGANPTDVTSAVNSFDFSNFSAHDLQAFLGDLKNMGYTRLQQQQSSSAASYGANLSGGGAPAQGITATDQGAYNTNGMTPSSAIMNALKTGIGFGAGAAGAAVDVAKTQGAAIIGGGLAEKVLGL